MKVNRSQRFVSAQSAQEIRVNYVMRTDNPKRDRCVIVNVAGSTTQKATVRQVYADSIRRRYYKTR